jgi:hypothetical protein
MTFIGLKPSPEQTRISMRQSASTPIVVHWQPCNRLAVTFDKTWQNKRRPLPPDDFSTANVTGRTLTGGSVTIKGIAKSQCKLEWIDEDPNSVSKK